MNKSLGVYKVNRAFQLPEKIDLPTCMYSMRTVINSIARNETQNSQNELIDIIMDKKPLPELSSLERRVDSVIEQLSELIEQVKTIKSSLSGKISSLSQASQYVMDKTEVNNLKLFEGAVINANPSNPPYSLFLINHLSKGSITFSTHVHSSVNTTPNELKYYQSNDLQDSLKMTLIWKKGLVDSELVLNPVKELSTRGEVNILRHLGRTGLKLLKYPAETGDDIIKTIRMDSVLDLCHRLIHTHSAKERTALLKNLNAKLEKNPYYGGDDYNICDISAWSAIKQICADPCRELTPNMAKWYNRMDELTVF